MTQPNDGGPAFPLPQGAIGDTRIGMSLRDWFAGQALCGLLAGFLAKPLAEPNTENARAAVDAAFQIANAMLAEREKQR